MSAHSIRDTVFEAFLDRVRAAAGGDGSLLGDLVAGLHLYPGPLDGLEGINDRELYEALAAELPAASRHP
jgi:hypothetical protein